MMSSPSSHSVVQLAQYQQLLRRRKAIIWPLLLVTLLGYFSFILTLAFSPEILSLRLNGGVISLGILVGLGVILLTFLVTGLYVYLANRRLEPLIAEIHQKAPTKGTK